MMITSHPSFHFIPVLLWEAYAKGADPYPDMNANQVKEFVNQGGRLSKPEICPEDAFQIMNECWQHSPTLRPNFHKLSSVFRKDSSTPKGRGRGKPNKFCGNLCPNWSHFGVKET